MWASKTITITYRDAMAAAAKLAAIENTKVTFKSVETIRKLSRNRKALEEIADAFSLKYRQPSEYKNYVDAVELAKRTHAGKTKETAEACNTIELDYFTTIIAERDRKIAMDDALIDTVEVCVYPVDANEITATTAEDAAFLFALEPLFIE